MSKKTDIKNLADAYKTLLLNEAVKPTESNEPTKPLTPEEKAFGERARANGKNWTDAQTRLMFQRQNEINAQKGTNSSIQQNQTVQTPQVNQTQQSQLGGVAGSQSKALGSVGNTIQPQQSTQNNNAEGWQDAGTTVQRIPNAVKTTSIAAGDDEFEQNDEDPTDDEGYEEVETTVERIPNAVTTTPIAAGDDEFKGKIKKIKEKYNISKFLKHLSEKNYSSAHKYLKAVLDQKVKNNISKGISKI
jgi:hypothetical protein